MVLSAALSEPAALVEAAAMLMTGAAPPLLEIGSVPVTPVTVAPVPMPSSLTLSADDMTPSATVVTAVTVTFGVTVAVPVMTTGAEPVTDVTVPEPPPLEVETLLSIVIVMPRPEVSVIGGLDDASVTVVISESPILNNEKTCA